METDDMHRKRIHTSLEIQHLDEHESDVYASNSKWILPHCTISFLLLEKILEGLLLGKWNVD